MSTCWLRNLLRRLNHLHGEAVRGPLVKWMGNVINDEIMELTVALNTNNKRMYFLLCSRTFLLMLKCMKVRVVKFALRGGLDCYQINLLKYTKFETNVTRIIKMWNIGGYRYVCVIG